MSCAVGEHVSRVAESGARAGTHDVRVPYDEGTDRRLVNDCSPLQVEEVGKEHLRLVVARIVRLDVDDRRCAATIACGEPHEHRVDGLDAHVHPVRHLGAARARHPELAALERERCRRPRAQGG